MEQSIIDIRLVNLKFDYHHVAPALIPDKWRFEQIALPRMSGSIPGASQYSATPEGFKLY